MEENIIVENNDLENTPSTKISEDLKKLEISNSIEIKNKTKNIFNNNLEYSVTILSELNTIEP
jgi:hypothetical protein